MANQVEKTPNTPKKPSTAKSKAPSSVVPPTFPIQDVERYMDGMFDTWRGMMHSFLHAADGNGSKNALAPLDLEAWQRQADNYFADVQRRWSEVAKLTPLSMFNPVSRLMAPAFDLSEEDDRYLVSGVVPGMDADDLSVEVDGHMLRITGKISDASQVAGNGNAFQMAQAAGFTQTVCLPHDADTNSIEASVTKGVLNITLKKDTTVESEPKTIPVKG